MDPVNRRTFLVVLGYGRLQRPTNAIDATLAFLRQRLLPQDVVAVLIFDRVTDFTTDHEAVLHLVERYKAKQDDLVGAIETFLCHQHNWCPGAPVQMMIPADEPPELPPSIQAEIDALFESPPPRTREGMGSVVRFRSVRDLLFGTDIFKAMDDEPFSVSWNLLLTIRDHLKVEGGFGYLHGQPSDKHLIALTPHPIVGPANMQRFAERANSARVAVDLILTGGLPAVNTGRRGGFTQPQFFDGMADAEELADLTGGQFLGNVYADKVLTRIDAVTRFRYLLGYVPAKPTADAQFHHITVTVRRPGATVLFRHSYQAAAELTPAQMAALRTSIRLQGASETDGPSTDLKLTVSASVPPPGSPLPGAAFVNVAIDPSRLSLVPAGNGVYTQSLEVEVYCGDAKQHVVGSLKARLDLKFTTESYARALADGVPYSASVPVTGPVKYVKVVVYDAGADLLGSATYTVK